MTPWPRAKAIALWPPRSKAASSSRRCDGVKRSRPSRPVRMMETPAEGPGVVGGGVMDCIRARVCNRCRRLHSARQLSAYVSLFCSDPDPAFAWCEPTISHIAWDSRPVVRRVVRWAANVSHGRDDRRQTLTKAEFVEGGTVGPVKG